MNQRKPKPGDKVRVAQKKDYTTGELTTGVVQDVLTKKDTHPRGHKVRLTTGIIGRVQEFAEPTQQRVSPCQARPTGEKSEPIGPDDLI
ncbi:YwbE family protein [Patescibacteria group bacterium]|nr:YwbE family protein [Patescibacteria group bacterium]MBU1868066.1 YwbE family protein [Patescibacteria group bacterium]